MSLKRGAVENLLGVSKVASLNVLGMTSKGKMMRLRARLPIFATRFQVVNPSWEVRSKGSRLGL